MTTSSHSEPTGSRVAARKLSRKSCGRPGSMKRVVRVSIGLGRVVEMGLFDKSFKVYQGSVKTAIFHRES
jgi:hypothetical protein